MCYYSTKYNILFFLPVLNTDYILQRHARYLFNYIDIGALIHPVYSLLPWTLTCFYMYTVVHNTLKFSNVTLFNHLFVEIKFPN